MKIIDRYIVKEFLFPLIWCIVVFIYLYVTIDLFSHLDDIIKKAIPLNLVFNYYASFIPVVFVQAAPLACLVSTVYSLGKLNRYNEIMAMKAGGISLIRILSPLIVLGVIISSVVFFANDRAVPTASNISYQLKEKMFTAKESPPSAMLTDIVLYGKQGRLYHIGKFNAGLNDLEDITILEHDENHNIKGKIFAKSGKWLNNGWIFYNGIISRLTKQGEIIGEPEIFNEKAMDIKELPGDFIKTRSKLEFMRYAELKEYVKSFGASETKLVKRLLVELNYKLAFPWMSLITVVIGAPFALKRRHGGVCGGFGISIVIAFLYYWIMSVSIALGKAGILPSPVSAWSANVLFGALGLMLILRHR